MSGATDLCFLPARTLVSLLRDRTISAREVMRAHLDRIERLDPTLNAIVARVDRDTALALAGAADARLSRGEDVGPLHGLPWAFKDMQPAAGFPCTMGSRILRDHRPASDSVLVERIRRAGALPIGKTNVPEFGLGSHTYNDVYGTTRNPWDPTKSAGGSSGGAGAALAAGMLPLADGGDMGGSLRNPAHFNGVVGFRPSPGVVPDAPSSLPFGNLAVHGPMARDVADAAFLLSVIAGEDARDPASLPIDAARFAAPLGRDLRGVRVAWCPDLGGLPLDRRVREVLAAQRAVFEQLGCIVEDADPALHDADAIFLALRAFTVATLLGPLLASHRELMKPEAIWNVEQGLALRAQDVGRAMAAQSALLARMRAFFARHDFLVCAVNQVPAFDAELDWPKQIDGVPMEHYLAWMKSAYWISATLQPAISVPAGFTPEGLPVGIQIVGRLRDDRGVLEVAHAFEEANDAARRRPALATT
ncbi:MAG: amidase [Proteobacteria bacterium]|nr:MAG: amidase [Pseudomonadota bacterium]